MLRPMRRKSSVFCGLAGDLLGLEFHPEVHVTFLARVGKPELFTGIRRFKVAVNPAREFRPIQRKPKLDHFGGQVTTVGQVAFGNSPPVVIDTYDLCAHGLAFAQAQKRPFGLLAVGVREFWRIDAKQTKFRFLNAQPVAICHIGRPGKDLFFRTWRNTRDRGRSGLCLGPA